MGKTYKDFYNNDGFRDYHALNHAKTKKKHACWENMKENHWRINSICV